MTTATPPRQQHRPYVAPPSPRAPDGAAAPRGPPRSADASPVQPAWSARQEQLLRAAAAAAPPPRARARRLFADEPSWADDDPDCPMDFAAPLVATPPPAAAVPDDAVDAADAAWAALLAPDDADVDVDVDADAWAAAPPLLAAEVELVCAVVGAFDGYPGSLPAEGVRATVWRQAPGPYLTVVEDAYGGRWDAFLEAHPDLVGWEPVGDRLYLATSPAWAAIDAERAAVAEANRRRLRETLAVLVAAAPPPPDADADADAVAVAVAASPAPAHAPPGVRGHP